MLALDDARGALAEIDELSDRARRTGDPALELEIVRRRHRVGRSLLAAPADPPASGLATTLAAAPDPFPFVSGRPPEIDHREMTPDVVRGALAHHGCLLVHDFFDRSTIERLRNDIDHIADGFDRWMASSQQQGTPGWYEPFEDGDATLPLSIRNMCGPLGTFYSADSPRGSLHLTDAFDAAGMPELLTECMDEPVLLGIEKTALRRVPPNVPTAWHQDGIRFGRDVGLLNVWVALCHCGIEAPTLGIFPMRPTEILPLDVESEVPWEIRRDALAEATAGVEAMELVLRPGDAVLFDEMLLHTTVTHDRMSTPRHCADAWFFPRSAFPTDLYIPLAYVVP